MKSTKNLTDYVKEYKSSVDFKIYCMHYHYERILEELEKGNMQTGENRRRVYAEIEALLFSMVSAIDLVAQDLNQQFELGIKEKQVSIDTIKKRIAQLKGTKQKKAKMIIDNYCCKNEYKLLKHLRNKITHRSILDLELNVSEIRQVNILPEVGGKEFNNILVLESSNCEPRAYNFKKIKKSKKPYQLKSECEPLIEAGSIYNFQISVKDEKWEIPDMLIALKNIQTETEIFVKNTEEILESG